MEVFYVVLLVLVAGVVPSHGRTESEGTVFNKTQLHESMSNVTVNSSKVLYSFSYLALQWPKSFCIAFEANFDRQCNPLIPHNFTVHGLWPQYNRWRYVDCRGPGRYQRFNYNNQLSSRTLRDLDLYWPSLDGYNQNFWEKEYYKHGSCTFYNQDNYFRYTLALFWPYQNLISELTAQRFVLGRSYSSDGIRNAVYGVTSKWATLKCVTVRGRVFLLEIRFCVNRNGVVNCRFDDVDDCGNSVSIPRP